jgi:hypothetical protein
MVIDVRHVKKRNATRRRYQCPNCGKRFTTMEIIDMKEISIGDETYSVVDIQFAQPINLQDTPDGTLGYYNGGRVGIVRGSAGIHLLFTEQLAIGGVSDGALMVPIDGEEMEPIGEPDPMQCECFHWANTDMLRTSPGMGITPHANISGSDGCAE